jgi:thiamine transport system ATP-binding protein
VLAVRDVTAGYDTAPVLRDVSLSVAAGEIVALLGPSGSGKSTLLRVIAGLVAPTAGTVHLDGEDITALPTHRRDVGMVFQDEQLFPHRDVAGNIAFGLRMHGWRRPDIERRVAELLDLVGLAGFERRDVTSLSGGEAKRVALARSLAPSPRVLLLDEPLTGLDRELHDRLAVDVARILRAAGTTALLVTHDGEEAAAIADRVVRLGELGDAPELRVVELDAAATHELRRRVLRNGDPDATVVFDGDDDPTTIHLGVEDAGGALLGVSTWLRRPGPVDPSPSDRQLRGMAVDNGRRGGGIGGVLLAAGVQRSFDDGAAAVWANARDTALAFYERHGFAVVGDGFVDPVTGLPHHRIRRSRGEDHQSTRDSTSSAKRSGSTPSSSTTTS